MDENEPKIPREFQELALVFASSNKARSQTGAAYYRARKILDYIGRELGIEFKYEPMQKDAGPEFFVIKPFEISRSAKVLDKDSGQPVGFIGEYKTEVSQKLKLPKLSAGFEIDIELLQNAAKPYRKYIPLNRFPSLEQDITLRTEAKTQYAKMEEFMRNKLDEAVKEHGYNYDLAPIDIFQKEDNKDFKQITWRISLAHSQRTLTTEESNKLLDKIANESKKELNAERI
jgi:phenylalanyl-tRNA synthetase beta subunit